MKYPFVGYRDAYYDIDGDEDSDGYTHDREFREYNVEIRERCAACHRAEFANVSEMYLAGEGYDSNGMWTRARWDKLLPKGWDNPADHDIGRREVNLRLKMGGTCRFKSHLYHTLLHYKLYLVCKIRHKMDSEGVSPDGLRDERFKEFWDDEKAAVEQLVGRAEKMAKMKKNQADDWRPESWEGIRTIRRWLNVPTYVMEQEEAKRDREDKLGRRNSSDADGSDSSAGIERGSGGGGGRRCSRGRQGAAGKGGKRGRYGGAISSDSEDSDDLSNFIVDD
eukprot:jgi/Undpi1/4790/HiC_scaffold_19.g08143.m1